MGIIEQIEKTYKDNPMYMVKFSINYEGENYDGLEIGDVEQSEMQCGTMVQYQPITYEGVEVGYVRDRISGKLFDPPVQSYCHFLADCSEDDILTYEQKSDVHFADCGEHFEMQFATMKDLWNYVYNAGVLDEIIAKKELAEEYGGFYC